MVELVFDSVEYGYRSSRTTHSAIDRCSFSASGGEIIGVVGSNGAGKTTMLRLVAGELSPARGKVFLNEEPSGTLGTLRMVGFVGDPPLLPTELTGLEWLRYISAHRADHPGKRTALVGWAIESAELEDFVGRRMGEYSRGMTQRISLATAAILGSDLIVLDEAMSGIDPLLSRRLRGQMENLASMGRLVIVASHDLAAIERVASRVLVMSNGRIVADVSIAELIKERVAELSLSGSGLRACERLLNRFPGAERTGDGVAVPLIRGLTIEETLAACRTERIPIAASRIRYRALEDILITSVRKGG